MNKTRLEAFSDGVLAIIITIMVLEIKVPHGTDWHSLRPLIPVFLCYVISFLLIGIYWGNHHHMLHAARFITSRVILANLNLLFWLSLVPVATGWMGENHFAVNTIILYAILLVLCGVAYGILQSAVLKCIDKPALIAALQKQTGKIALSFGIALAAIPFAFISPIISGACFFLQSAVWLIPDRNIERALKNDDAV